MVRQALYAAKICSYSQGMNIIRAKSIEKGWNINMGSLARIWKVQILLRCALFIIAQHLRNLALNTCLKELTLHALLCTSMLDLG